jgi:hypothetical protein
MEWRSFDLIEGKLRDAGYRFGFDSMKVKFKPSDVLLKQCEETGTDFAQTLRKAKKLRLAQPAATPVEQAVGRIVGSVCVVTAKLGEVSTGMMGSWISQATFNPPGLTVAIAKDRAIDTLMYPGGKFVLNILPEGNQQEYMKHFRKSFAQEKRDLQVFLQMLRITAAPSSLTLQHILNVLSTNVWNVETIG